MFDINVFLMLPWWPDVTIVQSDVTIVVPWQLSTGSKHDYCPLVGILFGVLRIVRWWFLPLTRDAKFYRSLVEVWIWPKIYMYGNNSSALFCYTKQALGIEGCLWVSSSWRWQSKLVREWYSYPSYEIGSARKIKTE